mmetsp:Transcript_54295/g.152924  ORF Transcript_54295/g.152924 Transcript_54295/m.152924 type:complete len:568 (-) Transcript_54295:95-1798(-)
MVSGADGAEAQTSGTGGDCEDVGEKEKEAWFKLFRSLVFGEDSDRPSNHDEVITRCASLAAELRRKLAELVSICIAEGNGKDELKTAVSDRLFLPTERSGSSRRRQSVTKKFRTSRHFGCSPLDVYDMHQSVGEGTFGSVCQAYHKQSGQSHAIKTVPKAKINGDELFAEIELLKQLDHPHILRMYSTFEDEENIYMASEICTGGEFFDTLARVGSLEEHVAARLFKQILGAVVYLHGKCICHRDLKPANFILSDDDKCLQLADFGLAMLVCGPGQMLGEACGSLPFVAPEILETRTTGRRYDGFLVDCWSLAVNFYELLGGPFSVEKVLRWIPKAPPSIETKIRDLKTLQAKAAESLPGSASAGLRNATMGLFEVCPQARWSAEAALGPQGLNIQIKPSGTSNDDSSLLQRRGRRATHAMSYVSKQGVASRALLAEMLKDLERKSQPQGCPFAHSRAEVMSAFSGLPAKILADPLLAPFHEASSITRSSCGIVMSLYPQLSGDNEEERRSKLRSIHAHMEIKDTHYDALLKLVRDTFEEVGLATELKEEAMDKLEKLRCDIVMGGK